MNRIVPIALCFAFAAASCTQEPAISEATPETAPTQAEAEAPAAVAEAVAPAAPAATLQEIMKNIIVPSADVVWNAVSYRSTPDGVEMVVPATDADWQRVRDAAMQLVSAGDMLKAEGLPVAAPDATLQDEGLEGNLTREQIQTAMQTQRAAFTTYADLLQAAAMESITAIDARDAEALSNSGGTLDGACESCHTGFWYPAPQ